MPVNNRGAELDAETASRKEEARSAGGRCNHSAAGPLTTYWQASQVPPLRIASMEQAFFSSAVNSRFGSAAGRRSRFALSMALLFRVRR